MSQNVQQPMLVIVPTLSGNFAKHREKMRSQLVKLRQLPRLVLNTGKLIKDFSIDLIGMFKSLEILFVCF